MSINHILIVTSEPNSVFLEILFKYFKFNKKKLEKKITLIGNLEIIKNEAKKNKFNLEFNKILNLDGWGDLSVSNLKYSIDQSKKVSLDKFLYAIGIRHIGIENAKLLAEYTTSVQNFISFVNKDKLNEF